jgi:hypothetical protein
MLEADCELCRRAFEVTVYTKRFCGERCRKAAEQKGRRKREQDERKRQRRRRSA